MPEASHNLTGVKIILSIYVHRQHLFVFDKMILTLITMLFSSRSTSAALPIVCCSVSPFENTLPHKDYKIAAQSQLSLLWC